MELWDYVKLLLNAASCIFSSPFLQPELSCVKPAKSMTFVRKVASKEKDSVYLRVERSASLSETGSCSAAAASPTVGRRPKMTHILLIFSVLLCFGHLGTRVTRCSVPGDACNNKWVEDGSWITSHCCNRDHCNRAYRDGPGK
ncbi:hypothetical protein lerEdw1_019849 [Lerista edwardsae]|nr:hypothetical protein lerEdw1_019849 [Lerista edwardsae]